MNEAIKRAIEGGWKVCSEVPLSFRFKQFGADGFYAFYPTEITDKGFYRLEKSTILLDPLFWQALGKAEGWKLEWFKCSPNCGNKIRNGDWEYQMHRFLDHIIQGGNIDDFFKTLLKNGN